MIDLREDLYEMKNSIGYELRPIGTQFTEEFYDTASTDTRLHRVVWEVTGYDEVDWYGGPVMAERVKRVSSERVSK